MTKQFQTITRVSAAAITIALTFTTATQAVIEDFTYSDGPLSGQGTSGDWDGAWGPITNYTPTYTTTAFGVESNQLKVDPFDAQSKFDYTDSGVQRSLTSAVSGSAVYVSYEITPGEMGQLYNGANTDGSVVLALAFADVAGNVGSNAPMVTFYEYYNNGIDTTYVQVGISLNGTYSTNNTSIGTWTPGQSYTVVGKIEWDANGSNDRFSVWLNPASSGDAADGFVEDADLGYSEIGIARFYNVVDKFVDVESTYVDNIRIGTTWESVTGPVPEPASLLFFTIGGLALLRRQSSI